MFGRFSRTAVFVASVPSELRKSMHKNVFLQLFLMDLRLKLFNRLSCLRSTTAFS